MWMCGRGNTAETRGKAFVVYEDIFDAQNAVQHLNGFNVLGRYMVVLYYHPTKQQTNTTTNTTTAATHSKESMGKKRLDIDKIKSSSGAHDES